MEAKVKKLEEANFVREVKHAMLLKKVVMVKELSNQWRMCMNFTDLNKSFLEDAYPFPSIDWLVDGTLGHQVLNFLDAYSKYNQIPMYHLEKEKIAFITNTPITAMNLCYSISRTQRRPINDSWTRFFVTK